MVMKDSNYFDPRDHEAFVRELDNAAYLAAIAPGALPKGAIPKRRGMTMHQHLSSVSVIAICTIPFWIAHGDGAANGAQFTGSAGAGTLSAAILANAGQLMAGCYSYFPDSFGGSSLPAGWYWTEFSTSTAFIVYQEKYVSGVPKRPDTRTPIATNLTGWVTGTTNEVVGPTGFLLPPGALGKNGALTSILTAMGAASGNRQYYVKADDASLTTLHQQGSSSSTPWFESMAIIRCVDSHVKKLSSRRSTSEMSGIGVPGTNALGGTMAYDLDTSVPRILSLSLKGSTNIAAAVLIGAQITATYGD